MRSLLELRSLYSDGEIVELPCAVGLFNYFNPFHNMLSMEPTKQREGGNHTGNLKSLSEDPGCAISSVTEPAATSA